MEDIYNLLLNNTGNCVFGTLFIGLFVYTMKNNAAREIKYQKTIDTLQSVIKTLSDDIQDKIKGLMEELLQIKNKK